jgi:Flp pilus assembly protein TadG
MAQMSCFTRGQSCSPAGIPPARPARKPCIGHKQRGAFAIMTLPLIMVMIGFCGLALDVGRLYNRKADLSGFTKAVALAAAHELNGTAAGIAAARAKARATAEALHYEYFGNGQSFVWNEAALSFGNTSSGAGDWNEGASPADLYFVKVDTRALGPAVGSVNTYFIGIVNPSLSTISLSDSAIAGRTSVGVTPLAICAMDSNAATERTNPGATSTELVQYGFRRGISYDLMQLNPNGIKPVRYLVNPVIAPGVYSSTFDTSLIGAFICTGTMWVPKLTGGAVRVSPLPDTSPLAAVYRQLNSRFDDFTLGLCNANGAPPDYNVKSYAYDTTGGASWMNPATGNAAVASTTSRNKLETIADLPTPPAGTTAGSYGPIWSLARAVKYSSYIAGAPEPSGGYATFAPGDWSTLYKLGPTATGYTGPTWTPYQATSGATYKSPSLANLEVSTIQRRVLNISLLACPIGAGSNLPATVLAVGKFFMTVPATQGSLVAEFAGVLSEQALTSEVELFP